MKTTLNTLLVAGSLSLAMTSFAVPKDDHDPVPPATTPLGLSVLPTIASGTEDAGHDFNQNVFKQITQVVNGKDSAAYTLDPSKLFIQSDCQAKAFFVGEAVDNHSFGMGTAGKAVTPETANLLFANVSTETKKNDPYPNQPPNGANPGDPSNPLFGGDYVNLGTLKAGTQLDFFAIVKGAQGGTVVEDSVFNPDAFRAYVVNGIGDAKNPYLVIAYQPVAGGLPDMVFALDIGGNIGTSLVGAPEPSFYLSMGSFLVAGLYLRRRMVSAKA